MKKLIIALSTTTLFIGLLGGCSGDDDSKEISLGAKNFTEQFLLAKMTQLMLEDNDFDVDMTENLGSSALRQALESGDVELTWEYTGTGLVTYNDQEPIADKQEAFDTISEIDAEQDITWTNLSEVNNTYTLVMRSEDANEKGIESISDLAEYVSTNPGDLRMATDAEFANRPDGLPGIYDTYGFEFDNDQVSEMTYGLNYDALNNEEVSVAVGFSTDSRIRAYDLVNLVDDQGFFPSYNAAISMRTDVYEQYPEIEEILQPLADGLNSDIMIELNYLVDVEEESVTDVARDFLQEEGYLE